MSSQDSYTDLCICCGAPVPEGRMICYACESGDTQPVMSYSEMQKAMQEKEKAKLEDLSL